jgi:subtilase family serine protease
MAQADGDITIAETIETNNVGSNQVRVGADLILTSITLQASVPSGSAVTLTDTTKNQAAPASNASTTYLYLSKNTVLDASDTLLGTRAVAPLDTGQSSTGTTNVTIPAGLVPGVFYIIGVADRDNGTPEGNETNNVLLRSFTVTAGS